MEKMSEPKILFLDIETSPIIAYTWGIWEQNVGLTQIKEDWSVLAWCAKWAGSRNTVYRDQRKAKNLRDDRVILKELHGLLDQADIIVTQNGRSFDAKKLNARFIQHGFKPPAPYKHIDTKVMAKSFFGFTSNKLEYLTDKLCTKYKKLTDKDRKFVGFDLWKECLAGNTSAWREMERYNRLDVLSLEELYEKLAPWGNKVNFNLYRDDETRCNCGSKKLQQRGYAVTQVGRYARYQCQDCGTWTRGAVRDKIIKKRRI